MSHRGHEFGEDVAVGETCFLQGFQRLGRGICMGALKGVQPIHLAAFFLFGAASQLELVQGFLVVRVRIDEGIDAYSCVDRRRMPGREPLYAQ